jgi:hypothetical protein
MRCERYRSAIREVALGETPSVRLEAHLASCPACRAVLGDERRRLAGIDDELTDALAVEPPVHLLSRVREIASRGAEPEGPRRLAWLLPLAASAVALAFLLPLARRVSPPSAGVPRAVPSAQVPAATRSVPTAEATAAHVGVETQKEPSLTGTQIRVQHPRPAARRQNGASPTSEPDVVVPPGGEAALRRFVAAIRDRRLGGESVLGPGPDAVDWGGPEGTTDWPRPLDRLPAEAERAGSAPEIVPRTLSD